MLTADNDDGDSPFGFETTLWATADEPLSSLDAGEYNVLGLALGVGLIFPKHTSSA